MPDGLVGDATVHGKVQHRSPLGEIEYWARIGKMTEKTQICF